MDEYENMTDEEIWDAWQRENQASYDADMRALAKRLPCRSTANDGVNHFPTVKHYA